MFGVKHEKTLGQPLSCTDVGQEWRQLQGFKLQPSGLQDTPGHQSRCVSLQESDSAGREGGRGINTVTSAVASIVCLWGTLGSFFISS